MRIAVLSDIHANLAALEAVLRDAAERGAADTLWVLGDIVGYGPNPCECLDRLRECDVAAVAGNHDLAAIGAIGLEAFNPLAAAANRWTAEQLREQDRAFLCALPRTVVCESFSLAHGSLRDPVWEYVITVPAALGQFAAQATPYGFVGHTHVPLVIEEGEQVGTLGEVYRPESGATVPLTDRRLILNPGSVGQPRDGDPRAAYALLDTERNVVQFFRVPYDIARTQREMAMLGLPLPLIARLAAGR